MAQGTWRVGTSGWVYQHWRGRFYPSDLPATRWFGFYAGQFSTVEVNNSFYRLPSEQTFTTWARKAPPGFVYAVKASQYITHFKRLLDPEESLQRFLGRARLLGEHLGPILFQLPPRFACDLGRLEHFLSLLPTDLAHVFEFRDSRWLNDDVYALLRRYDAGLCIADLPGQEAPVLATSRTVYVRFHGNQILYADGYGRDELALWSSRLAYFVAEGHDIYAYFNNDGEAHAIYDPRTLTELLTENMR